MKGAGPGDERGARPSRGRVPADPGSVPGEMLVATVQTGTESLVGAARSGISSSALVLLLSASKISAHKWQRGKLPLVQCQQSGGGGGLSVPSTTSGDSARL